MGEILEEKDQLEQTPLKGHKQRSANKSAASPYETNRVMQIKSKLQDKLQKIIESSRKDADMVIQWQHT